MDAETKIAFEKLGQKMHEGFGEMHREFGFIHQKFEGIDQKFEGIDQKFEKVDQEFKNIRQEFKNVRQEMKTGLSGVTDLIIFEIGYLKIEINGRFSEVNKRFDTLYAHVDGFINLHKTLDMGLSATRLQQGRLEERVANLEAKA